MMKILQTIMLLLMNLKLGTVGGSTEMMELIFKKMKMKMEMVTTLVLLKKMSGLHLLLILKNQGFMI